eukprot:CAMPEP_0172437686 /NCGR_PEP_ID=MMETSP1064-20121228/72394_1 /TAXON_ID=202472 /ORGANISM="Aulacoseira subarctica , Strain CCAP 1002/5" /LENGTH=131 /DNA_ID=CAMNT_0013186185 /DNA_START=177 /DNA_END=570 /DNA_ORIENTATION=-
MKEDLQSKGNPTRIDEPYQRSNGLHDEASDCSGVCTKRAGAANEGEINDEEPKEDCESLEEDVAVIIEEEQEVMQYRDDVGNAEQLLRDQTIQTEAAEAVMQVFTMAPRIFISLNSSSDLRTMIFCIVKHW